MELTKLQADSITMRETGAIVNAFEAAEKSAKEFIVETVPAGGELECEGVNFAHSVRENPKTAETITLGMLNKALDRMPANIKAGVLAKALEFREDAGKARGPVHVVRVTYKTESGLYVTRHDLA